MTVREAVDNIGARFKIDAPEFARWTDEIKTVDANGIVHGNILSAHASQCRFVNEQPAQLKDARKKKKQLTHEQQIENDMLIAQRDADFKNASL